MTRVAKPGLPDLKVEIAPTATPFTTSPTWVDITTDLRLGDSVTATRGRTDARSQAQPGTLSLTLNNPNGNYTPGLASGAYHPLKLRCPIRLSFKPPGAGAYTVMWTGLIDEYAPGWAQSRPIVTLQASDRLSQLNRVEVPPWEAGVVLQKSPNALFPLTETAGSQTVGSIATTPHTMTAYERGIGGSFDLGSGSLPVDEGTVCAFTPADLNNGWFFQSTTNGSGAGNTYSTSVKGFVSVLMNSSTLPTGNAPMFAAGVNANDGTVSMGNSGSMGGLGIGVTSTGRPYLFEELDNYPYCTGDTVICDGDWHHVVGVAYASDANQRIKLYVDGVLETQSLNVGFGVLLDRFDGFYIGGLPASATLSTPRFFSGQLAMCAAWNGTGLVEADIVAAGYASLATAADESSTARFTRLCSFAGITGATVGTGSATVGRQKINSQSVLDALDDVGTAEQSPVYVTGAGVPTLAARSLRYGAAVALTIDARDVGSDVKFTYNGDGLINDAKGTRLGGAEQRVTNDTSIATHGASTFNETFILNSDAQVASVLQWLTTVYGDPYMRTATLRIDGWVKQASVDLTDLLALEVGSRVQVTNMPAQAPSSTLDLFAEGFSDVFTTNGWQRTVNTSGATPYTNVWILGDTTYSVLGSTTIPAL